MVKKRRLCENFFCEMDFRPVRPAISATEFILTQICKAVFVSVLISLTAFFHNSLTHIHHTCTVFRKAAPFDYYETTAAFRPLLVKQDLLHTISTTAYSFFRLSPFARIGCGFSLFLISDGVLGAGKKALRGS